MKLLIDTNVILDMVLNRSGCNISMELFRKVKAIGASAYITASEAFGKKWKDFEDCVQYTIGENNRIDYIITMNHKDYEDALLPIITPTAWIEMIDRI